MYLVFLGVIFSILQLGHCKVLPVDKCQLEDSACMKAAFQKALPVFAGGLPDQGVEVLDTMNMEDIHFELKGLKGSLFEGKMKGLKKATVDNVTWDTNKKTISVTYHLECIIEGHYSAGGSIMSLPINGDGEVVLKIKNIQSTLVMSYTMEKGAEGKDHVILKKYSLEYDVKDDAHVSLTNLFDGNKSLSDPMLKFLNDNLKELILLYGRPLVEPYNKKIFKNMKEFLLRNAISDLANV